MGVDYMATDMLRTLDILALHTGDIALTIITTMGAVKRLIAALFCLVIFINLEST